MKLLLAALLALSPAAARAGEPSPFVKLCETRAAAAEDYALPGAVPPWLFLRNELEHLGTGTAWQTPEHPSLAVITKFRESLTEKGVKLVLVPVPSKAALYPEKMAKDAAADSIVPMAAFLEILRTTGADVIDLEPAWRELMARDTDGSGRIFCQTDSHWSPLGLEAAAGLIFDKATADPAVKALVKEGAFQTGPAETLAIKGDLTEAPGTEKTGKEEVTLHPAGKAEGGRIVPVPEDSASPVVLLGDSHTMVFTDGATLGMHCQGAGLRDHLQAKFGLPLAQVSNQNSGADGARRLLTQRVRANPDWWSGRKLVVWVFSVREFTQGKWR